MIKAVIIEDELLTANRLEKMLAKLDADVIVIAKLDAIKSAVVWLQNNTMPDLLFMDIQIADGLSFEIFKQVKVAAPVIFTTAYDEYAIQAFKVNSVDYLLKPIEAEDLKKALDKFSNNRKVLDYNTALGLLNKISIGEKVYKNRFLVNYRDLLVPIGVDEIAYFSSELKHTFFVTHDGVKYKIDQTMEEIETELDPTKFFRVTRQYIISHTAIVKIHNYFNGRLKLELKPAAKNEIIVSRDKSNQFKQWLNK
jgi:two-component system, LytTR family, response regulator LytT